MDSRKGLRFAVFIAVAGGGLLAVPVVAQPALPIAEGVWVETRTACAAASDVMVYSGHRIGEYIGAVGSLEPIAAVTPAPGGWTRINPYQGAGLQVMAQPGGQVVFRYLSPPGPREIWRKTTRACPLDQLSPSLRSVVAPFFRTSSRAAPPASPRSVERPPLPAPVLGGWSVLTARNGTSHAISPMSSVSQTQISLTCSGGQATAMARIPGRTARYTVLDAVTSQGTGSVTLDYDPQTRLYTGSVQYGPIVALLSGAASVADLRIEGRAAGHMSLAGSGAAIRYALASCWQASTASVASPAIPATAPVGPLGIAPGYYVDEDIACGQAYDTFFYDGTRIGRTDLAGGGVLRVSPVGRVIPRRGGTLLLEAFDIELRRLANNRIELTIQDTGPPMRICSADQVPRALRARPG